MRWILSAHRARFTTRSVSIRHFYTASTASSGGPPSTHAGVMPNAPVHQALTFDVKARCSVWHVLPEAVICMTDQKPDYESPSIHSPPSSWSRAAPDFHARCDSSFSEGLDARATGRDELQTMSEQYIPSGPEAWSGGPRQDWWCSQASRMGSQYSHRQWWVGTHEFSRGQRTRD